MGGEGEPSYHEASATVLLLIASLAPAQTVTATQWVTHGKGKELLRKINGRWWSNDNREVFPPSRSGLFWELDSEPGVVEFYHHTPADTARAESLHLFMSIPQVESVMGKPNRIFRMGPDGGMWMYYGADGLKVQVRIMDGVLGEAEFQPPKSKDIPVASVAADLGGRSIYKLLAERAGERSKADHERVSPACARAAIRSDPRKPLVNPRHPRSRKPSRRRPRNTSWSARHSRPSKSAPSGPMSSPPSASPLRNFP